MAFLGEVNSRDNTVGNGVRAGGVPVWVWHGKWSLDRYLIMIVAQ